MSALEIGKQVLFQSSVGEVVRKMRNSKKSEAECIGDAINETREELKSRVVQVKVKAIEKLTYFSMLGYSGEYGSFNVTEIMSSADFGFKRTGYIAASCTFTENTSVLPLCTAQLKRDMASNNQYDVCLALYCLSCIATPDLARDLVSDVVGLLGHQRPIVRKKAILCLYKIFLQFPEALRPTFPKLKVKIEDGSDQSDSDPAVRGAVVNIFCELVRRNPQNFLNLVPPFFNLCTTLHNNWTLIKVIKLLGCFVPLEPRLGKKLIEPLTNLITSTAAKSVQYECLYAVASGMRSVSALLKLAIEKLKPFAESRDPNLRYLGLEAMTHIIGDHPKQLMDLRESLVDSLTHNDPGIRSKGLILYSGLATKKNLQETVNKMFEVINHVPDDEWSNQVIKCIIETISRNDYELVQDFDWYVAVLLDLAQIQLSSFRHGGLIENEFVVVLTRVPETRPFGIENLAMLLHNPTLLGSAQAAATSRAASDDSSSSSSTSGITDKLIAHESSAEEKKSSATSAASSSTSTSSSAAAKKKKKEQQQATTNTNISQWNTLKAAAFLCGEFPQWIVDKKICMTDLMHEKITHAPPELQATCVTAALKLFLFVENPQPRHEEVLLDADEEDIAFPEDPLMNREVTSKADARAELLKLLLTEKKTEKKNGTVTIPNSGLYVFTRSVHSDVQERALLASFAIRNVELHITGACELTATEVEAIIPGAQEHVAIPEDVDLSRPFADDLPALVGLNEKTGDIEDSTSDDDDSDDDEGTGHLSAAAAAIDRERKIQEAALKQRKRDEEIRDFILKDDESGAAASPNSPLANTASGAGGGGGGGGDDENGSPSPTSLRLQTGQRKKTGGAGGIKKQVSAPSGYTAAASSASPNRDDENEDDEAARKMRGIKVTGPMTKEDVLPTIQPYQRVDPSVMAAQSAAPSANAEAVAAVETKRITASSNFAPIELFSSDSDTIQVEVQFVESKLKKDGTVVVTAVATIQNKSSANSVYNVGLMVPNKLVASEQQQQQQQEGEGEAAASLVSAGTTTAHPFAPQLTDSNGVSVAALTLCDKAKQGAKASSEFSVLLDGSSVLCSSSSALAIASIPLLPVTITFKMQKQDRTAECQLQLPAKIFMASESASSSVAAVPTSQVFNTSILPNKLSAAGCLSASIPMPPPSSSLSQLDLAGSVVNAVCQRVGLHTVDVFKQSVTLCGLTLHRKTSASDSYVALLIHADTNAETGDPELNLVAKANSTAVAEAILTEAAEVAALALSPS